MKNFILVSKKCSPDSVYHLNDTVPRNGKSEPLTDYEAFKIYDSGVVKFSPLAEYAITNLMTVPSFTPDPVATRKAA